MQNFTLLASFQEYIHLWIIKIHVINSVNHELVALQKRAQIYLMYIPS